MSSERKVMMDALVAFARELRDGAYYVRRGVINWALFDFSSAPLAVALMIDEASLIKGRMGRNGTIGIEMMARMRDKGSFEGDPQLDDGLLDEMWDDMELLVTSLIQAKNSMGDPVIFKHDSDPVVQEVYDASLLVQGLVTTIGVVY